MVFHRVFFILAVFFNFPIISVLLQFMKAYIASK